MPPDNIQEEVERVGLNVKECLTKLEALDALQTRAAAREASDWADILKAIGALETEQVAQRAILTKILQLVSPPQPVACFLTITSQGDHMNAKASLDILLKDDGTALLTLGFKDKLGAAAVLPDGATISSATYAGSDPSVTVTPAADNLTAVIALVPPAAGQPPTLVTGITFSVANVVMTNADSTTTDLGGGTASQALDIIASGPASVSLALSSN